MYCDYSLLNCRAALKKLHFFQVLVTICIWLHFQSILPISIPPSHPPLNRAALQVSVGLWYLFMINEGEKKMQMPPTDAMRDKSESEPGKEGRMDGREEGREEERQPPSGFSPEAAALPGNRPSIITHLRTSTPAKHTQRSPKKTSLRIGVCQRIQLESFQSNTLPCLPSNNTRVRRLWVKTRRVGLS